MSDNKIHQAVTKEFQKLTDVGFDRDKELEKSKILYQKHKKDKQLDAASKAADKKPAKKKPSKKVPSLSETVSESPAATDASEHSFTVDKPDTSMDTSDVVIEQISTMEKTETSMDTSAVEAEQMPAKEKPEEVMDTSETTEQQPGTSVPNKTGKKATKKKKAPLEPKLIDSKYITEEFSIMIIFKVHKKITLNKYSFRIFLPKA